MENLKVESRLDMVENLKVESRLDMVGGSSRTTALPVGLTSGIWKGPRYLGVTVNCVG